jgi:hypothetical protein
VDIADRRRLARQPGGEKELGFTPLRVEEVFDAREDGDAERQLGETIEVGKVLRFQEWPVGEKGRTSRKD